jgi:ferredoxin-NADP reductase/MOSC domain-containing protein YiiM
MKLVNVSAGTLHSVQIGGEVVTTGHLKQPQAEPWLIDDNGVAGDRRAVHPDRLYGFSRAAYDHWGRELGVDPARWPDGFFGENLTFDSFDERALRVGDVFSLGSEVRLFVAGARNPCLKLSWRLGQPPEFQQRFAKSRHAGVYFGIIATGRVRPGDRLERIEHDAAMPSVADVSDFLIDRTPPPLAPLRRLLESPRLSIANRMLLGAKLEASERAEDETGARWPGWRPFIVDAVVDEAPEIRSVRLVPADGAPLPRAEPGQFVSVELDDGEGPVRRSWSLSSFAFDPLHYRLTVRRQAGRGSRRLHALVPGDRIRLRPPAGRFTLDMTSYRPLVLVAAGIGITPLKAMLDAQLARRNAPPVHLIYGGRDPAALAFREELAALAEAHDSVTLTMAYSRADVSGAHSGRITPDLVIDRLSTLSITIDGHSHRLPWFEAAIHICGPADFCRDLREGLLAKGGNAGLVMTESFVAPVAETTITTARISFAKSGTTADWTAADGLSLLELAEANDIVAASDCRAGSCLTCRSKLITGSTTADLGDGTCLPCIARPLSRDVTLEL